MAGIAVGWIVAQVALFLLVLLLGWLYFDKRYKHGDESGPRTKPSNGFLSTPERFVDPKDGHTYRVYFNPRTGEREYVRED